MLPTIVEGFSRQKVGVDKAGEQHAGEKRVGERTGLSRPVGRWAQLGCIRYFQSQIAPSRIVLDPVAFRRHAPVEFVTIAESGMVSCYHRGQNTAKRVRVC